MWESAKINNTIIVTISAIKVIPLLFPIIPFICLPPAHSQYITIFILVVF